MPTQPLLPAALATDLLIAAPFRFVGGIVAFRGGVEGRGGGEYGNGALEGAGLAGNKLPGDVEHSRKFVLHQRCLYDYRCLVGLVYRCPQRVLVTVNQCYKHSTNTVGSSFARRTPLTRDGVSRWHGIMLSGAGELFMK